MADEQDRSQKTEEPTQRKLEEARRKGDLPVSRDVASLTLVLGCLILVGGLGPWLAGRLADLLLPFAEHADGMLLDSPADAWHLLAHVTGRAGLLLLPVAVILVAGALLAFVAQNGIVASAERIQPKLDRLSPIAGVKRVFSLRNLVEFLKGLAKISAVGVALAITIAPVLDRLEAITLADAAALPDLLTGLLVRLLLAVLVASLAIALVDLVWQQVEWRRQQRMSLQELKDEFRQTEGDPHVKGRIRQLRRERARNRMFQELPTATVVITNPTHYAVALRYDLSKAPAPVCVAKGVDLVARRIREKAAEHQVPLVENPPLARTLHASVDIGEEVEPEHYMAVAEIITVVLAAKARSTIV